MQQRTRQTSPTFRSTLSLTDNGHDSLPCGPSPRRARATGQSPLVLSDSMTCGHTPRRARGAGQSPPRSSLVLSDTAPTGVSPPLAKSQSYCPAADGAGCPEGGRSYFLHGNRAHVPAPQPSKATGFATFDPDVKHTSRKHFKSLVADNKSQHFESGSVVGQTFEYTSKREEYKNKRERHAAASPEPPAREPLQEKQNAPHLQSKGFAKAMADLPPSPKRVSRQAMSPQCHLQSPGVAKSLLGKTESPCRQHVVRKGSPTPQKESWSFTDGGNQSPRLTFWKQTERSPAPPSPRRPLKCQSPRACSPSPPWGTDNDAAVSGYKPGSSPIRNQMSSDEAKNMQLRGRLGSQPGTFGSSLSARPPRTACKVPPLRNDPTVPKQFYMSAKPNPAVIQERVCYYGIGGG